MESYSARQGKHYRRSHLNCMCGISSYMLFRYFRSVGLRPTFCMNDNHCFLRLGEYWVDLTLTQFDGKAPTVWFRRKPYKTLPDVGNVHRASKKARTYKKIRKLFRGWPIEQNPFKTPGIPDLLEKSI
jgi:hypothetical protein